MESKIVKLKELCDHFNVGKGTIYQWIKKEDFPTTRKQGRTAYWKRSEVDKWVTAKVTNPNTRNVLKKRLTNLDPNYQPPQQGLDKLKRFAKKSRNTPPKPKQELLSINPAFEEKILSGVIQNITAALLPQIEQTLNQQTNQIIQQLANNLLNNFGK